MLLSEAITHVGKPPAELLFDEHTVKVHNFNNLTKTKGEKIVSPALSCAGHKWILWLFPGGAKDAKDGMVSVCLRNMSSDVFAAFAFIIKDSNGGTFHQANCDSFCLIPRDGLMHSWDYIKRDELLNASDQVLPYGTLVLKVHIRLHPDYLCDSVEPHPDYLCDSVEPQSTLVKDVMTRYNDGGTADVSFRVMGKVVYAHKWLLKTRAPDFADLCDSCDKANPLPIDDVEPEIFEVIVKFLSGEDITAAVWKEKAEAILKAAGKYGFRHLKRQAEVWHVKNVILIVNNVVDFLLQADGNDLPLLKKASLEFILANAEKVINSQSYTLLSESPALEKEVLLAMSERIIRLSEYKKQKPDSLRCEGVCGAPDLT